MTHHNPRLYSHVSWEQNGQEIHVGFTSIGAGNLGLHVGEDPVGVLANRAALERSLHLKEGSFRYLNQVHGIEVFDADSYEVLSVSSRPSIQEAVEIQRHAPVADAAVTGREYSLAVMVADCIPLVFVGETQNNQIIFAVAHAGRQGLLSGVIQQTVGEMVYRGAEKIQVWLGPSICGSCYEVPEAMRKDSAEKIPEIFSTTSWGTPALDLPAAAVALLRTMPMITHIHRSLSACTFENKELFSHRRGNPHGRIAGLVWAGKERKGESSV